MKKTLRVLHIFPSGDVPTGNPLHGYFEDDRLEIERVSVTGLADVGGMLEGWYDIVYCGFALPLVPAGEVPSTIERMTKLLADRGELWLVTPSLEWCAKQILSSDTSPAIHAVLFGDREHPSRSGFTLAWLRALVEEVGLIPRKVQQGIYQIALGEQVVQVPCNIVIGWKVQ